MLIYQMTHIPSGKIYIGSLKNDDRWTTYLTSSTTVKPMMKSSPSEWTREILLKDFNCLTEWKDVVALEQAIIESTANTLGWDKMFNRGVFRGQIKLAAQTVSPRKGVTGIIPWNKGKKGVQSMPESHPWKHKTKSWNTGIKLSDEQKKNMGGKRLTSEQYSENNKNRPILTCPHCLAHIKGNANLKQHINARH